MREVGRCVGRVQAAGLHVAEEEVGERAAGVRAVEGERTARVARLFKGDAAARDVDAEAQEVLSPLPRERVGELEDGVRTVARSDLALEVVSVESAVRSADADGGRAVLLRQAGDAGQSHFADHVEGGIVGGSEYFELAELAPADARSR